MVKLLFYGDHENALTIILNLRKFGNIFFFKATTYAHTRQKKVGP
jgi:hypothetical protein